MNAKSAFLFLLALAATVSPTRTARGGDEPQAATLTTGDGAKLSARYYPGEQGAKSPAVIVLDDFGQGVYARQHMAHREWFGRRGLPILESPTGQGVVIW